MIKYYFSNLFSLVVDKNKALNIEFKFSSKEVVKCCCVSGIQNPIKFLMMWRKNIFDLLYKKRDKDEVLKIQYHFPVKDLWSTVKLLGCQKSWVVETDQFNPYVPLDLH